MFFPVDGPNASSSNRNDPLPDIKKSTPYIRPGMTTPKPNPNRM
jgi:hypothetical protein